MSHAMSFEGGELSFAMGWPTLLGCPEKYRKCLNFDLSSCSLSKQQQLLGDGMSVNVCLAWYLYVWSHSVRREEIEYLKVSTAYTFKEYIAAEYDNVPEDPVEQTHNAPDWAQAEYDAAPQHWLLQGFSAYRRHQAHRRREASALSSVASPGRQGPRNRGWARPSPGTIHTMGRMAHQAQRALHIY